VIESRSMRKIVCFLLAYVLLINSVWSQTPLICAKDKGNWIDTNYTETCIPCPTLDMYVGADFKGLKLPKNCNVQMQGVFVAIPKFEKLLASHEYVLELDVFKQNLDKQHQEIILNLNNVQTLLSLEKKEKLDLAKSYTELEKKNIELKYARCYWMTLTFVFLTFAVIEAVVLL
jgi:hypothetical protein